jgi:putative protease
MPERVPELVAPAGSFETAEAALQHGADALYAGMGMLNLRAHCANFDPGALGALLSLCRHYHARLYCALNIWANEEQLHALEELLDQMRACGSAPDAFIVSDPGIIALCRRKMPGTALHMSTQHGTCNTEAMRFWASQGITRFVLPRELDCTQIRTLTDAGIAETEVFIHGAMCVSVSGRCLLGAYMHGRHPNHGDCPQPCRYAYDIHVHDAQESDQQSAFQIEETSQGTHILNAKDLNTIDILDSIVATGVHAVKIEGRHKSVHYVASVVRTYRHALDTLKAHDAAYHVRPQWHQQLDAVVHRPYTTGFYAHEYVLQDIHDTRHRSSMRICGVVKETTQDGAAVIDVKHPFHTGDTVHVLPARKNTECFSVHILACSDLNARALSRALTNRIVTIRTSRPLHRGDLLRRDHTSS